MGIFSPKYFEKLTEKHKNICDGCNLLDSFCKKFSFFEKKGNFLENF